MAKLTGKIVDGQNGVPVEARVQVLSSEGRFIHPQDAILKVGTGLPFFYSAGDFALDVPRGLTRILVERGTEYRPAEATLYVPSSGTVTVDIELERWAGLGEMGWHPGNTHIHYDEKEQRPDGRLYLDPRVEDLRFTAISVLKRWDLAYASNKYPPGMLTQFCSAHHYVECGEENRHNGPHDADKEGYGHVMLLRIQDVVEPISRGYLVDETDPDYPPLCYACDDAHRQGGIVIWCHNGNGLEAPVAAALGKLDAFNLFDPYWMDPEYDVWYAMLNCGFKLPASTGSDWFICSANRVYAYTGRPFDVEGWISALSQGRTFVTNGPALFLTADDQIPGGTVLMEPGRGMSLKVFWESYYPVEQVEIIWNGRVVHRERFEPNSISGTLESELHPMSDGWVAARLSSAVRDSFFQPIYAHTSPIYVVSGRTPPERRDAAAHFAQGLESAVEQIDRRNKFLTEGQRKEVIGLFREGQSVYKALLEVSAHE